MEYVENGNIKIETLQKFDEETKKYILKYAAIGMNYIHD